ncbi:MAG: ATP-dependent DNA helicase [Patescibacteria group bacterium]|nr:ATP-dependent DNA helicase [Patescibacteria group bacterium]MDD4610622.1 ATP-dependent DNA helicase [Patescibacteria group bacterium]
MSNDLMKNLNKEQLAAATHQDGPLLIVAGAGTGKTTALIGRLENLLQNNLAALDEILLLTFTEKATEEMEDRALKLLPYGAFDYWINTFHKFCERLLRAHALDIGLDPGFKLLTETDQWILIKKNLDKFDLDYYRPLGNPNKFIFDLIKHFSRLKDEDIAPADYLEYANGLRENQDAMLSGAGKSVKSKILNNKQILNSKFQFLEKSQSLKLKANSSDISDDEVFRINELANAFHVYNQLLLDEGYLDFGDLICQTLRLFRERPSILKFYQEKFKYIMVDEFQDTNWAQYELLKILAKKSQNLLVVGDDDQSIYKFRGASLSNIMQFKDDFPGAKEIVLNKNYRSGQKILDAAYEFIQRNNPNRLEKKLKIKKQLVSQTKEAGQVGHLGFPSDQEEINWITDYIIKEYKKSSEVKWSDFAILVRSNSTADQYAQALTKRNIPNLFVSQRGLYYKGIVLDCLAYLRLLDNYHESSALFRVLGMEAFKIGHEAIIEINKYAKRKVWSLYEALYNINAIPGIEAESVARVNFLLSLVRKHSALVKTEKPSAIFVQFVWDAGLNKKEYDQNVEYYSYLNQFYQKIKRFEEANDGATLKDFVELMKMEMEAGETGGLRLDFGDDEVVKIMTVHAAKGLEFDYVFLPDLVDKRFPTINRTERISVPDELVKEKLPEGKDVHLEEERRLFYVALTRAKKYLFLSSARDCGGAQEKKPSIFVAESGIISRDLSVDPGTRRPANNLLKDLENLPQKLSKQPIKPALPARFSFSQVEAYAKCPLQYRFSFILRIPVPQKSVFVFGRVMHDVLRKFLTPLAEGAERQFDLFGQAQGGQPKIKLSEAGLLKIYDESWQSDWYDSKTEREKYYKKGKESLKKFYADLEANGYPEIMFLEKNFLHKIENYLFKGAIDRIDKLPDGTLEIIDYKTGAPKERLDYDAKRQLVLYKIVMEESFNLKVSRLSFYYLDNAAKVSFEADDKIVEKLKLNIREEISRIQQGDFSPKPGPLCAYCDFRDICEFRKA